MSFRLSSHLDLFLQAFTRSASSTGTTMINTAVPITDRTTARTMVFALEMEPTEKHVTWLEQPPLLNYFTTNLRAESQPNTSVIKSIQKRHCMAILSDKIIVIQHWIDTSFSLYQLELVCPRKMGLQLC